jgi:peptidoglycan/xylan/chitin deacetylase (PgdA/CDA1 family)
MSAFAPLVAISIDAEFPDGCAGEAALAPLVEVAARTATPLTLFVEGRWARARRPDLAAALACAPTGTVVGLHSYSHVDFRRLTVGGVRDEIVANRAALVPTVVPAPLLRLPYGHGGRSRVVWAGAAAEGVRIVGWDAGSRDWDPSVDDAEALALVAPVLRRGGIVLFHSWPRRTPRLLATFVERGLEAGVRFVPVPSADPALQERP